MPDRNFDAQIQARVGAFAEEVTVLIREAALETVREALGEGAAPSRAPGQRRGKTRATKARGAKARTTKKRASKKKAGRRRAQTDGQVAKLSAAVVSALKAEPAQSISTLAAGLGQPSAALKRPIAELLEAKRIKKKGQRRGTRYSLV